MSSRCNLDALATMDSSLVLRHHPRRTAAMEIATSSVFTPLGTGSGPPWVSGFGTGACSNEGHWGWSLRITRRLPGAMWDCPSATLGAKPFVFVFHEALVWETCKKGAGWQEGKMLGSLWTMWGTRVLSLRVGFAQIGRLRPA